ncbi:MAG: tetratricopeptide repeat protein [Candidatus Eremiobacterota bacterium]
MIYCDKCGYQNRDSARFCKGCGGDVIPTTPTGILQSGTLLDKRYEIKCLIKSGGMGAVYEALDHRFDKIRCAVKEMIGTSTKPDDLEYMKESFRKEANILRDLRHVNLPVVIDYFIEAGRYYIVMDYVEGKDLETLMHSYGRVPENFVIEWSKQILDALYYLHSQSPPVIYRDMKPGNVMLRTSDSRILLVDFGIARAVLQDGDKVMTVIGTPVYAPDELFQGKPEPRSDLYSLGATMHCLLTGVVPAAPFSFKPVRELNSDVSEKLENIVMKALSMKVEYRYRNAKDMKEALLELPEYEVTEITLPFMMSKEISQTETEKPLVSPTEKAVIPQTEKPVLPSTMPCDSLKVEIKSEIPSIVHEKPSKKISFHMESPAHEETSKEIPRQIRSLKPVKGRSFLMTVLIVAVVGGAALFAGLTVLCLIIWLAFGHTFEKKYNNWRGHELYNQARYEEAIKYYNRALEIDKNDIEALNGKKGILQEQGDELYNQGKYEDSLEYYEKVLAIDENDPFALHGKASVLKARGDDACMNYKYKEALEYYDKALNISPDYKDALNGKKNVYIVQGDNVYNQGKYLESIRYYNKALDIDSNDAYVWFIKGWSLKLMGHYEEALKCFKKTVTIDETYVDAWRSKGDVLKEQGHYEEAIIAYDKALKIDSKWVDAWCGKGNALYELGDYEEAIKCYDKALDISPEHKYSWNGKGNVLYSQGHYEKAIEYYDKALSIDPDFQIARDNRENALKAMGKY